MRRIHPIREHAKQIHDSPYGLVMIYNLQIKMNIFGKMVLNILNQAI